MYARGKGMFGKVGFGANLRDFQPELDCFANARNDCHCFHWIASLTLAMTATASTRLLR